MDQKLIFVKPEQHYEIKPNYIIVGEAPGADEERFGMPFCGRSGIFLREALNKFLGFDSKEYYITNVVKVRPSKNRTPSTKEIYSWCDLLAEELEGIDPNQEAKIISVGKVAEKALDYLRLDNHFIYHPAHIMVFRDKYHEWVNQIRSIDYEA